MYAGTIGNYEDYPELFVRWFEWGAFQPVMRAHGERNHNEMWSYGKQADPILAKYLKLRYQLLPYTYSIAYRSYQTGAPYMRPLFMFSAMDFIMVRNCSFVTAPRIIRHGEPSSFACPALHCKRVNPRFD